MRSVTMRGGEWFKFRQRRDSRIDEGEKRRSTGRHGGGSFTRIAGWWRDSVKRERPLFQSGKSATDQTNPFAHGHGLF